MASDDDLNLSKDFKAEGPLASIEELYSSMEEQQPVTSELIDGSRPSSTVSLSSWTFSPISALDETDPKSPTTVTKVTAEDHQCPRQDPGTVVSTVSATPPDCTGYPAPPLTVQHYQPHIQNFITNYCISPPWKEVYAWNAPTDYALLAQNVNMGQQGYPVAAGFQPQGDLTCPTTEPADSLSNLNTHGLEQFTRCSTPEYMMALNSLNQPESPNNSTRQPMPECRMEQSVMSNTPYYNQAPYQEMMGPQYLKSMKIPQVQQDSGYSSDLDVSPVIAYQDRTVRRGATAFGKSVSEKVQPSSSQCFPVLRLANYNPNKENIHPSSRRLLSSHVPMAMQGFAPNQAGGLKPGVQHTALADLTPDSHPFQKTMPPSVSEMAAGYTQASKVSKLIPPKCQSVADYEAERRQMKADMKRKLESNSRNLEASDMRASGNKRRRHNEPLQMSAVQVMTDWYDTHIANPYPNKAEKEMLAKQGQISVSQVKSWFANKRNRSNNTRPKKQKQVMADRLMNICHQLAQDARRPNKDNAYYIQQLSSIISSSSTTD